MRKAIILLLILAACTAQAPQEMDHAMPQGVMKVHASNDTMKLHDYTITFERPELTAGKEAKFAVKLMKGDKPLPLQPLHGAPMHVIVVSKDLNKFYHLHPEETAPSALEVHHTFEEPGEYRMWVEYMSDNLEHIIDYDLKVE